MKLFDDIEKSVAPQNQSAESASLSKGQRNRNPGNLEDGPFARSQPGYKGSDGRFAIFDSEESGRKAQENLLRKKYKGMTPAQVVQKYAPLGDNSEASVRNYIGYVAARAGISPDSVVPDAALPRFAAAMREFETGKTVKIGSKPYQGQLKRPQMATSSTRGITANASQPGVGIANTDDILRVLQNVSGGANSQVPAEQRASQGVTQNSAAIFGSDKKIDQGFSAVESEMGRAGAALDVLDQVTQAAHEVQITSKIRQIEDTRAISDEIVAGTQELKRQTAPVFQARQRVADQLDKLATMNPLERTLRGVFDLNYDQSYLTGQLDSFDRTLKMRADDFNYVHELGKIGMAEIERRYGLDTGLTDLQLQQAKEDFQVVGLRVQQTAGLLQNSLDQVQAQSSLIAAKRGARQDMLGRIDSPTISDLYSQAVSNNGIVSFNGVEFSAAELRDQLQTKEQQETNLRLHQIAAANGEMQLAESVATNITRSLTREQAQEAIANGGVWRGIQLPQDQLNSILASHDARIANDAQRLASTMPSTMALQAGSDAIHSMQTLYARGQAMNLGLHSDGGQTGQFMNQGAEYVRQLTEAVKRGDPPEIIAVLTAKVAQNAQQFQNHVDSKLLQAAGGDKTAAGYMKGFLYNTPLDSAASIDALTYFAMKGSLPQGITASPASKQIFQRAQQVVQNARAADPKITTARLKALVQEQIGPIAAQVMGQSRFDEIESTLPARAKRANHAFGRINQQDWQKILAESQMFGYQKVAAMLNTSPENVAVMVRTQKPLNSTPQMEDLFKRFSGGDVQGFFNAQSQQYMLSELDKLPSATPGRRNSSVLQDWLTSADMAKQIHNESMINGSVGFGDYLVNPLAPGATESAVSQYNQSVHQGQAANYAADRNRGRQQQAAYANNPVARALTVLSMIEGVGVQGRDALAPFVKQTLAKQQAVASVPTVPGTGDSIDSPRVRAQDAMVKEALSRTKFDDPALEAYRKVAIKGWDAARVTSDSFVDRLTGSIDLGWGD